MYAIMIHGMPQLTFNAGKMETNQINLKGSKTNGQQL
jgi:hypothetical protein